MWNSIYDVSISLVKTRKRIGRGSFVEIPSNLKGSLTSVDFLMLHDILGSEKICSCGHGLIRIGEKKSEKLDIIPAKIQVEVHVRPKYACKHCEGTSDETLPVVRIVPVANQIAEKSMLSSGFLAYTITQKFADALPFYRQAGILQRSGVEISRSTLSDTVIQVYEKLSDDQGCEKGTFQIHPYVLFLRDFFKSWERRRRFFLIWIYRSLVGLVFD